MEGKLQISLEVPSSNIHVFKSMDLESKANPIPLITFSKFAHFQNNGDLAFSQ